MIIKDGWKRVDKVSGLKIKVVKGKFLDKINIVFSGKPMVSERDFYFTKDGKFDGTGSPVGK